MFDRRPVLLSLCQILHIIFQLFHISRFLADIFFFFELLWHYLLNVSVVFFQKYCRKDDYGCYILMSVSSPPRLSLMSQREELRALCKILNNLCW